jgi:Ni/Fe-hydrogenase subunit HybB-like protein
MAKQKQERTPPRWLAQLIGDVREHPLFYVWIAFLLAVLGIAGVAAILVWTRGLEMTGLSNQVPWGLWITVDLSAVALGAGSFATAALVHFLGGKRFAPVSRVALLIGLLADTGTGMVLMLDLGRPDRFYHPIIYWNTKSLLWVITWSVILYISVLVIELAPVLLESRWLERWSIARRVSRQIHKATPVVALLGIIISLIHLSATGAVYGILRGRPPWFDPMMPVIFLTSGIFAGLSFTIMLIVITSRIMGQELVERRLLNELGKITGWVILVCGIIRVTDLAANYYFSYKPFLGESTNLLYEMTPYSLSLTLGEFVFGLIIPLIIFFNPDLRWRHRNLVVAGLSTTAGLLLCRWNTTLSGLVATVSYSPSNPGVQFFPYSPTWVEWAAVAGVLAYAGLAYTLAVRFLPIFEPYEETETVGHSTESVPTAAT